MVTRRERLAYKMIQYEKKSYQMAAKVASFIQLYT